MQSDSRNVNIKNKPLSKEEYAYENLREWILTGRFKGGEILPQAEICEELDISTIPFRTAITRLISDGLVEQKPHHQPRVTTLSSEGLEELLAIRMHLETLAIHEAIPRIGEQLYQELENDIKKMDRALAENDMPAFGSHNKSFHLRIYQACPYPLLIQLISDLWDNSDRSRSRMVFGLVPGIAIESQKDHYKFLKLIKSKKVEEATELMIKHKRYFVNHIPPDLIGKKSN